MTEENLLNWESLNANWIMTTKAMVLHFINRDLHKSYALWKDQYQLSTFIFI